MGDASSRISRHGSASIAPLAMDARVDRASSQLTEGVDARALTSLVAIGLAMVFVVGIAIVGHLKHSGNATATRDQSSMPPLVNEGVEIPAPAINIGRSAEE